jgi:hypothetical protein
MSASMAVPSVLRNPLTLLEVPLDSFAFARDGFVVKRGCLPESLIDSQLAAVAAHLLRSDLHGRHARVKVHPEILRRRQVHECQTDGVMNLVHHERLLGTIHMLAGERSFPVGIGSPQATQVLRACNSCPLRGGSPQMTAWIALRAVALEEGLSVLPGSHTENRQCLRRLLDERPELAARLRAMREEGASLESWQDLESQLVKGMREQQSKVVREDMRLLALRKGDVLIHQQGLLVNAPRLDGRNCLVVRYSAAQLHRNAYFSDSESTAD